MWMRGKMEELGVLEYLVFDLDETIYPRSSGLMQAMGERISAYMIERLGMDPAVVPALRRTYWHEYGTTSRGLQLLHDIDVQDYMEYVHDLPLRDYIGPNLALGEMLGTLPQRKVVFTNATAAHAHAVLDVVGIASHFEAVYDAFFVGNESKPAPGAYRRLLSALEVSGAKCMMIEDTARNLRPARALGMVTVLIDAAPEKDLGGVDYVIDDIVELGRIVEQIGTKR
jgi:putative hydrolase of the HAD superfamily